ncbi:PSKH1 [Symbiodinium microadriaticum]|nr:PSKH1 [Symbiodinium microadriaticum]
MEFIVDMDEGTVIVGEHAGRAVALPLEFPKPIIHTCTQKMADVADPTGVISRSGILLQNNGMAYKMEDRVLKETIYGSVHCGFLLTATEEGYSYDQSCLVAIKTFSKAKIKKKLPTTQEDPLKEFAAMQFLGNGHPHLMGQLDCMEDDSFYYSVMNFCTGGELFSYLGSAGVGRMAEPMARRVFGQILDGLQAMHEKGVAHRDMSLENILIYHPDDETRMQVVLIDWGMCVRVPQFKGARGWESFLVPALGCCGKKNYISPEVIRNADKRTAAAFCPLRADIWATGVILFMLLTGIPPFETAIYTNRAYGAIKQGKLRALLLHWGYDLSRKAEDLLERLFTISPRDRLSIDEIREDPWMISS